MQSHKLMARIAVLGASLAAVGLLVLLPGCPAQPPTTGVTEAQADALIADKFNTDNTSLALWNIQPGLGTVMIEYGLRFAMLQKAAQAGDWGMAQYQLAEQTEIQEVGEITRPARADQLKTFEHTYLDPLAQDILAKDSASFAAHLASAIAGCNACHVATDHGSVVVQPPTLSPEDYLLLAASDPQPASSSPTPTPTPTPSNNVLSWSDLDHLVNNAFNTVNRDLALWNIQPGLGTVMIEYGRRFAMIKFAADAADWGMAQYQLKEQVEIQEVGETTRPARADQLKTFEHAFLDPLSAAIDSQSKAAFDTAFTLAINGCNACHQATSHAYVRVQPPQRLPEPVLLLGASAVVSSTPTSPTPTPTPSFPATNPTVDDASALIDQKLNTLDRSLALWNIQPGLGTVMIEYGYRFGLTWFAGEAANWSMAAYQVREAIEIQEVGETTRPNNAPLLKNFEDTFLTPLTNAINAHDKAGFEAAYQSAVTGCNGCHQGTGHPYVVIQVPTQTPADYLKLQ